MTQLLNIEQSEMNCGNTYYSIFYNFKKDMTNILLETTSFAIFHVLLRTNAIKINSIVHFVLYLDTKIVADIFFK